MTGDDQDLKTAMQTLARDADFAPDIEDVERHLYGLRRRRLVDKISVWGVVVVIIAGVVTPLGLLSHLRQRNVAASSSASVPTSGGPIPVGILGIDFPVCDVSTAQTDFGDAPVDLDMFGRGSIGRGCVSVETGNAYLASYVLEANKARVMGPVDCSGQGCHILGAVLLREANIVAVVVVNGDAADSVELYRINQGHGHPFTQLTQIESGRRVPAYFDWGGTGDYRAGANCPHFRLLDVWQAAHKGDRWHLVEYLSRIRGATVVRVQTLRSIVTDVDQLPSGGGHSFCGSPATP